MNAGVRRGFMLIARFYHAAAATWAVLLAVVLASMTAPAVAGEPAAGLPHQGRRSFMAEVSAPGQSSVQLYVEEVGAGPPLILIHGMGGSAYSWRRVIPGLAQHYRVFAIDLKGFGRSAKPFDSHYAPADQAALIANFMRRRGLSNATVVGHSFGGAVALSLALGLNRTAPGRIGRLVLMNAPAYPQPIPFKQKFLTLPFVPYVALAAIPPIFTARAGLQSSYHGTSHVTDHDVGVYADPLHEAGGRHALVMTMRRIEEIAATGIVENYAVLRMPALLIWCRADPVVPLASGQRLAKAMPHARLAVIERCDHTPAEEAPAETLALIRNFRR